MEFCFKIVLMTLCVRAFSFPQLYNRTKNPAFAHSSTQMHLCISCMFLFRKGENWRNWVDCFVDDYPLGTTCWGSFASSSCSVPAKKSLARAWTYSLHLATTSWEWQTGKDMRKGGLEKLSFFLFGKYQDNVGFYGNSHHTIHYSFWINLQCIKTQIKHKLLWLKEMYSRQLDLCSALTSSSVRGLKSFSLRLDGFTFFTFACAEKPSIHLVEKGLVRGTQNWIEDIEKNVPRADVNLQTLRQNLALTDKSTKGVLSSVVSCSHWMLSLTI